MGKRKNIIKNIIIIVLSVLIVGFIVYYIMIVNSLKSSNYFQCWDNDNCSNTNSTNQDGIDELNQYSSFKFDKLGFKINYYNNYLRYLPLKKQSYNFNNLTDEDISYIAWKYIMENDFYTDSQKYKVAMDKNYVKLFFKEEFGIDNIDIKLHDKKANSSWVLTENNNDYIAIYEYDPNDVRFGYYPTDIRFDTNTKEVYLDFEIYEGISGISKTGEGTIVIKIDDRYKDHESFVKLIMK